MSFTYEKYIWIFVIAIIGIWILWIKSSSKYYRWIQKYWFFERAFSNKLFFAFLLLGYSVLIFSLMDVRGKPEEVPYDIPDQKTVILIDSSASMLVEDVKPCRFSKALLVARDFIKRSVGHQFSIVLFSDIQKQIVPFTDDVNFLDSKLAALDNLNIKEGGSNIAQAIVEAVSYLKKDSEGDNVLGNLLVFTDGEESEKPLDLNIPKGVSVAVVGVGTNYGGPIPLRDTKGRFLRYKKYQGDRVVSRLNEEWFRSAGEKIVRYKYWVVLSYSIPTGDIISFFHEGHKEKIKKGIVYQSKSYTREVALIGVLLLLMASLGNFFKGLYIGSLCLLLFGGPLEAAGLRQDLEEALKAGEISRDHKLKLAELYLKDDQSNKAVILYGEIINNIEKENSIVLFNHGTALIKSGKIKEGLDSYQLIKKRIADSIAKSDLELMRKMQENTFLALNQQENQKKQQQKKQEDDKKDKKSKKKKEKKKKSKSNKGKGDDKKEQKKKPSKEQQKEKKQNPPKKEPKNLEEKEALLEKKKKMKRVPRVLNQLISVDRNIQVKQTKTQRSQSGKTGRKDW